MCNTQKTDDDEKKPHHFLMCTVADINKWNIIYIQIQQY